MPSESLSLKDIVALMKSCRQHGVIELSLGTLSMKLGEAQEKRAQYSAKSNKIESDEFTKEVIREKRDTVAHLLIEDPSAYEALLASGDLEESTDAQSDD